MGKRRCVARSQVGREGSLQLIFVTRPNLTSITEIGGNCNSERREKSKKQKNDYLGLLQPSAPARCYTYQQPLQGIGTKARRMRFRPRAFGFCTVCSGQLAATACTPRHAHLRSKRRCKHNTTKKHVAAVTKFYTIVAPEPPRPDASTRLLSSQN